MTVSISIHFTEAEKYIKDVPLSSQETLAVAPSHTPLIMHPGNYNLLLFQ